MRLRVLTWNIHRGRSHAGWLRLERMHGALAGLAPDLALLQEVLAPAGADNQALRLAAGWAEAAYAPVRRRGLGTQGNALLSHLPLAAWESLDVSTNPIERRHVLQARLDLPGGRPLHVLVAHLGLTGSGRTFQLGRIAGLVAALPAGEPLLVAGDFNDWRGHACGLLADCGLREAHHELHGRAARTFPAWWPSLGLDRIYVRGVQLRSVEVLRQAPWTGCSDHLPLTAEIETDSG